MEKRKKLRSEKSSVIPSEMCGAGALARVTLAEPALYHDKGSPSSPDEESKAAGEGARATWPVGTKASSADTNARFSAGHTCIRPARAALSRPERSCANVPGSPVARRRFWPGALR